MRRSITLLAVLLALPATASAKGVGSATVCGDDDCTKITAAHRDGMPPEELMGTIAETDPPPAAAPWFRLRITVRGEPGEQMEPFSFTNVWVPSEGLMRARGEAGEPVWMIVSPDVQRTLERAARGLEPFPAARLTGLDAKPPEAQVSEVVLPPERPAVAASGGGSTWPWIAGGVVLLALTAAGLAVWGPALPGLRRVPS